MFLSKKSLQKKLKLLPIDFTKPWWRLIADQKWLVVSILCLSIPSYIFWYTAPFIIERLFESPTVMACATVFIVWTIIECFYAYSIQINGIFQLQCINSIYHNAHQYLLTVDPRYHIHRSSGALLGKIDRAARGYEDLLDQITFEFLPMFVGIVAMLVAVSRYSLWLASSMAVFFVAIVASGYYFARYECQKREQGFIETDDAFRTTAVENLAQVQLVRATFASDYMSENLTKKIETNMRSEICLWHSYHTASFLLNMFYLGSLFLLTSVLAWQVRNGIISLTSALALTAAYLQSTRFLPRITKFFRAYMRGWTAVKDLFEFIPIFGQQHYPVLGPADAIVTPSAEITLDADGISFDYETAKLFNNHRLKLQCRSDQRNRLYGLIGASGSGKTTLISILGGLLKPVSGTVKINGIDIYAVNDAVRRQLIALQGQVSTNVRGTIKYNLLFGLPNTTQYDDQYLLDILQRVGLLAVLSAHKGLNTMLGEGGLNLSGGQRQRLNFAALYLRAQYYKPLLILIGEPTSSLDELSETAITEMIVELAQHSVTLVIAHRLKTVENATGLIDLSLLSEEKNIVAYKPEDLQKRSQYYCQLMQGKAQFDS